MKRMEKIGAVCFQEQSAERELSFAEILLDETLVQGEVWAEKNALSAAGGINHLLCGKRNYELLLRMAKQCRIVQADRQKKAEYLSNTESWIKLETETDENGQQDAWKTDCYLISRYKKVLLAMDCFNDAVMGAVSAGGAQAEDYLEQMLSESETYYRIYDDTQPVLIYAGDPICYQVLDTFSKNLGEALREKGCRVIYFDMEKQDLQELALYAGKRLKAVIGMQTYLFSAKKTDGSFIHDAIGAPEYYFVFDHPVWLRHHLMQVPRQLTVLTPDGNYAEFIRRYYNHPAQFFPPAGEEHFYWQADRQYDISFLGTNGDSLLQDLKELRKNDKKKAHIVSRYILYMRKNISETPEKALERLLDHYGIEYTEETFEERLYSLRWTMLKLAHYYRIKTVESLLKAGLTLHVFGESWNSCPLRTYPNLVCHAQAVGTEALKVYGNSKLSLNIMTWHKDGFTERIANAMLQKSVVVTDRTKYLEENFTNDKEMLIFDLHNLKELPKRVSALLSDEKKREKIAEWGYEKAAAEHTWGRRAEQLLALMK